MIHHNTNKNVVVYAANFAPDGHINQSDPIKVYWIMFEKETPRTEGLTMIEKRTAYGIASETVDANAGEYSLFLTILKDRKIHASFADGNICVRATLNGKSDYILERIFVKDYVQIFGRDSNGNQIIEMQSN